MFRKSRQPPASDVPPDPWADRLRLRGDIDPFVAITSIVLLLLLTSFLLGKAGG
jgi:hypothetical protein